MDVYVRAQGLQCVSAYMGLPLSGWVCAGLQGGASQVTFTNPIEIVKIRLQVAGEMGGGRAVGVVSVIRELGFMGLYKVGMKWGLLLGGVVEVSSPCREPRPA